MATQRLLTWCLATCLIASVLGNVGADAATPSSGQALEGYVDLTAHDFADEGPVYLAGQWRYAPGQLLTPTDAPSELSNYINVPHRLGPEAAVPGVRAGEGVASYGLTLQLPAPIDGSRAARWGLSFTTVSSAVRFYANGELLFAAGTVSDTPEEGRPGYEPGVYTLPPAPTGRYELLALVSNYDHARGGFWEAARVGPVDTLLEQANAKVALTMWLTSALAMMGLFHLLLWGLRYRDATALTFAMMCINIALRTLVVDDVYLSTMFTGISWPTLLRIEYATLAGIGAFGWLFFRQLFPQEFTLPWVLAGALPCVLYFLMILISPVYWFTSLLPVFHGWAFYTAIVGPALVMRTVMRGRQNAWVYLFCLTVLCLITLHDTVVVMFSRLPLIQLAGGPFTLLPLGAALILLPQAIVLAARTASHSRQLEQRSHELSEARDRLDQYSKALESRVLERTAALEAANAQLAKQARVDGLTGLGNRRHLDEQLARQWGDHQRRQSPLAFLLVDVDQFKRFNDRYGHLQGDDALREVSAALQRVVSRPGDELARFGGEEIAALLPDTDLEGARHVAERMRRAVESLAIAHEHAPSGVVTVSIGVASQLPSGDADADTLVSAADRALYRAKGNGRNQVTAAADGANGDDGLGASETDE